MGASTTLPAAALLLTDVVDSTKLSETLGDAAMSALWARHDRLARDLLLDHRGREIDKTDGFLLLFEAAADAVAYAIAYHRALEPLGIAARAGLHVGPVIVWENAPEDVALGAKPLEVEGLAKPTAARVMGLATGRQTLLTEAARDALGDTRRKVVAHGHWRMKGVSEPLALFEVGADDAPFTPPPDAPKAWRVVRRGDLWVPTREVPHSLPAERDAFVGRTEDLLALAQRLDDGATLVSVLGIGGTGKTRLVTRYAWTWLGDWSGGAWFCDLSEARDLDDVCTGVARALGVALTGTDPVQQLAHAIAGRGSCLVVLDNFEQVARHAADSLGRWLDRAPEARFVVTTREVLGLPGETTLALPPLGRDAAVALFEARAEQAKRGFAIAPGERADVVALVELLDRLPLAIELAAARVRVMAPSKLLARMSERFRLLASGAPGRSRHATLRAALDWSWDLLSADEQAGLAQLSVFEGGFTLESAEAVLALDAAWPMDVVQGLVDKSLVRAVDALRFDLLVSVQEYGADRLRERGGVEETEARHGAWFAESGTIDGAAALREDGGVARLQAVMDDLDNLSVASRRAVARGDGEVAARTAVVAWWGIARRGPFRHGLALLEAAGALPCVDPGTRALRDATTGEARFAVGQRAEAEALYRQVLAAVPEVAESDPQGARRLEADVLVALAEARRSAARPDEAREALRRAHDIYREVGDAGGRGRALAHLGAMATSAGAMDEAARDADAALAACRAAGDRIGEGWAQSVRADLDGRLGRLDAARVAYEAALAVAREVGDRLGEAAAIGRLGSVLERASRTAEARAHVVQALAMHRELGNRDAEAESLMMHATLYRSEGRFREALEPATQALEILREIGDLPGEAGAAMSIGLCWYYLRELDRVAPHYQRALEISRQMGARPNEGNILANFGNLYRQLRRPADARAAYREALAIHREVRNTRSEGVVLDNLAGMALEEEQLDEAAALFSAARDASARAGHRRHVAYVHSCLAMIHLRTEALDAARAELDAGEALARQLDQPVELLRILALRGELRIATGDPAGARAVLAEADGLVASGAGVIPRDVARDLDALREALAAQ